MNATTREESQAMSERSESDQKYLAEHLFNLQDTSRGVLRSLTAGVTNRVFWGDKVMLSLVNIEPFKSGKPHSHPEEQWGICLEGEGVRLQGGVEFTCKAGDFWYTPGGVEHTMRAGAQGVKVMDIFGPPREEYKTSGSGYGPGEQK